MMGAKRPPTMGVEEEFFLVDPHSRAPEPAADRVVARAAERLGDLVAGEFSRYQVEVKTPPCADATTLLEHAGRLRTELAKAAAAEGLWVCASGTPVVGGRELVAPVAGHPRYHAGVNQYRAMLDDFTLCAQHVHIHLPDRELAVLVSNHLRAWLPLVVALSANSPMYRGRDTGYASWRWAVRSRFPCLGPPPFFESLRDYDETATAMAELEAMLDADLPFWDVRPNPHVPTVEVRSMDVSADIDDMLALTVLIRALVTTVAARAIGGDPGPRVSGELLRAACWRAARDGWAARGPDPMSGRVIPVSEQTRRLIEHVRSALQDAGDIDRVAAFVRRLATRGCGADRQRAALARRGSYAGVVDDLVGRTTAVNARPAAD